MGIRKVQDSWAALDDDGSPTGNACFASEWYDYLSERVHDIIRQVAIKNSVHLESETCSLSCSYTNISVLETDGPYGGYPCSSEKHSHHEGAADSVYWQNR